MAESIRSFSEPLDIIVPFGLKLSLWHFQTEDLLGYDSCLNSTMPAHKLLLCSAIAKGDKNQATKSSLSSNFRMKQIKLHPMMIPFGTLGRHLHHSFDHSSVFGNHFHKADSESDLPSLLVYSITFSSLFPDLRGSLAFLFHTDDALKSSNIPWILVSKREKQTVICSASSILIPSNHPTILYLPTSCFRTFLSYPVYIDVSIQVEDSKPKTSVTNINQNESMNPLFPAITHMSLQAPQSNKLLVGPLSKTLSQWRLRQSLLGENGFGVPNKENFDETAILFISDPRAQLAIAVKPLIGSFPAFIIRSCLTTFPSSILSFLCVTIALQLYSLM